MDIQEISLAVLVLFLAVFGRQGNSRLVQTSYDQQQVEDEENMASIPQICIRDRKLASKLA
jgi:hypothetical protein